METGVGQVERDKNDASLPVQEDAGSCEPLPNQNGAGQEVQEVMRRSEKVGVSREAVGVSCEAVGMSGEAAGVTDEAVGVTDEKVGVSCEAVGVSCEAVGMSGEAAGVRDEAVGVTDEKAGVPCEAVGVSGEAVGVTGEKAGVPCEAVGVSCEAVGVSCEAVVVSSEKPVAVSSEKPVGVSTGQRRKDRQTDRRSAPLPSSLSRSHTLPRSCAGGSRRVIAARFEERSAEAGFFPDAFQYSELRPEQREQNFTLAFETAE
ncbi:UNVERIFIED_CONTAM: hypothetical protein FKN15_016119 [Acipenser sinensis]